MQEMWVRSLGGEDLLGEETAICSSILAWEMPRTEEPGGLLSVGSQRVGHDWAQLSAEAAEGKRLRWDKWSLLSTTGFEHTFLGAHPPHHWASVWLLFWKSQGAMSRQEQQILGRPWHGLFSQNRAFHHYTGLWVLGLPWQLSNKESAYNAGDTGSIPGSERSPGGGNGSPLKHSWMEYPMDRAAWWAAVQGGHKKLDVT